MISRRTLFIFFVSAVLAAVLTHGATLVAEQFTVRYGSIPGAGNGGGAGAPFQAPDFDGWVLNVPRNGNRTADLTAQIPVEKRNAENYLVYVHARSNSNAPTAFALNNYAIGGANFNPSGSGNDVRGYFWTRMTSDSLRVNRRRDDQNAHGGDYHVLVWVLNGGA